MSVKGGLLFAGVNDAPTQQVEPQKNKFGPRIGFAYIWNDKTTIRGGYGILWAPAIFSLGPTVDGYGALGFSAITNMVNSLDGGLTPFSAAAANTFGNAPRTIGARSPATQLVDLSVLKNTRIYEGFNAQFRLEAVNTFNTPIFRAPNTQLGNPNFGRITSQANFARIVQMSVRLMW
jgi:hypothetical protein